MKSLILKLKLMISILFSRAFSIRDTQFKIQYSQFQPHKDWYDCPENSHLQTIEEAREVLEERRRQTTKTGVGWRIVYVTETERRVR